MRAVAAGYDVTGLEASVDRVKRLSAGESFVEDIASDAAAGRAGQRPLPGHRQPGGLRGLRRRGDHRADPAARGRARPVATSSRPPGPWPRSCGRDRLVVLESTTYPGTTESLFVPLLEAGSGLRAGRRLLGRLQPRADRSGQPDLEPADHPEDRLRHRRRVAGPDRGVLRDHRRPDRAGVRRRGRPSWPSCWRTRSGTSTSPWSTSWRCSPPTWTSTSGRRSTRPPPSRSASCGSRPGPGSAGTACRSTRATCPGPYGSGWAGRSASSSWPTTSTTTCPNYVVSRIVRGPQPAGPCAVPGQGPGARPGVQSATPATPGSRRRCAGRTAASREGAEVAVADPHVVEDVLGRRADPAGAR